MSETIPEPPSHGGHSHSHNLKGKLTAKVGPLPAYAWAIVAVGAYLIFAYFRKHGSGSSAQVVADSPTAFVNPETGIVPVGDGSIGTPASGTGTGTVATNTSWSTMAANALFGSFSPSAVEQALSDFLAGNTLTSGEQPIIDKALKMFGSPPEGVIGGSGTVDAPATNSGPLFVVADQADADIAISMGIDPSKLRYSGNDPNAGRADAVKNRYFAPTGLATVSPGEGVKAYWLGLAGSQAPAGAQKVQGATRTDTQTLLQSLLNNLGL